MRTLAITLLVVSFTGLAAAQDERVWDTNTNAWLMYFGDHPVSERWGVHLEGQLRRADAGLTAQQLLLRPAVNYQASGNLLLTAGWAFIQTYRSGGFPPPSRFPEQRFFQQAIVKHGVGKFSVAHRYRLEQRFIGSTLPGLDGPEVQDWRYENRFRYMVRGTVPIARRKGLYLAAYEEFFMNFGGNVASNVFDQNRLYGAVGKRMGRAGNIEWGYLNQIVQKRNGRVFAANHTVQIGWFSNFSFR